MQHSYMPPLRAKSLNPKKGSLHPDSSCPWASTDLTLACLRRSLVLGFRVQGSLRQSRVGGFVFEGAEIRVFSVRAELRKGGEATLFGGAVGCKRLGFRV